MFKPVIAILEIGTAKTVVLIGQPVTGGHVRVIGRGMAQTMGVRKGMLIDLEQTRVGIDAARRQAEEMCRATVGEVLLVISGGHIATQAGGGQTPIRARNGKVTRDDMEDVRELAHVSDLGNDRKLMHTLMQSYAVDGLTDVPDPIGLHGKRLRLDSLFIHGERNRIDDTVGLLKDMAIETQGIAFSALTAAAAVLTPEQRSRGVVLIDLGGGTTNYVVIARNAVLAAGSFGVGGDHATSDLAQMFSIPVRQAEALKLAEGHAVVDFARADRTLDLHPGFGLAPGRSIKLRSLHTVIEARMAETLGLVCDRLIEGRFLRQLGGGVVYTGGGAYLPGLDVLTKRVLGMPSRIGEPLQAYVKGLEQVANPAAFAAAAGLLITGAQGYETSRRCGNVVPFIRRLMESFRK